jgi:hypothetical protein
MVTPLGQPSVPGSNLLDPISGTQSSLAVRLRRVTGSIVGRSVELAAIENDIGEARQRLVAVTLEGEPGVGKTRLLLAAAELATAGGFTTVAVTADEEIRGPFLLARSLFAATSLREAAAGTPAEDPVRRVVDTISGRGDTGFESLAPETRQLRTFDLACVALGTLAAERPLAILLDDVQWADDDSLRMLRYVVRSAADSPIFLLLTIRPAEFGPSARRSTSSPTWNASASSAAAAGTLHAGRNARAAAPVARRAARFGLGGGDACPIGGGPIHRRGAGPRPPRGGHAPAGGQRMAPGPQCRPPRAVGSAHADPAPSGAPAGRHPLGAGRCRPPGAKLQHARPARRPGAGQWLRAGDADAADELQPAVEAGLLLAHHENDPADFTFTHEQVRQFARPSSPRHADGTFTLRSSTCCSRVASRCRRACR